jgi:SpoVK/Ycf46/Vps4 family AAA+-type ATPase
MTIDASIIAALEAALDNDNDNLALRMHLAPLLLAAGRSQDALDHCAFVLTRQPDHLEALDCAGKAALAVGDRPRAESYRRLHAALAGRPFVGDPVPIDPSAFSGAALPSAGKDVGDDPESAPVDDEARVSLRLFASADADPDWVVEQPPITLTDVAGMDEVKRRLNIAFLAPMRNPEVMKLYGKSLRGGLLLYGPPGCGKTYIARATAGELGARFLSIGLSDILDMYLGQSERNLHEIFETARRNRPCVLFFDEIDALGRKRSLMRESAGRDVVNQLLAELDSLNGNNAGIFVLAATNHPWDVDTALRRPGRLDRTLLVLPPDQPAREAILRSSLDGRPLDQLDYAGLAARTVHFSGADVVHLCESAAELAMEASLLTGAARPIMQQDFERALKEVKSSTRPWFETARNYAMFANEGGTYDALLEYLRTHKIL